MTVEELEQELRETFFCPDRIDDSLSAELEQIREALERKRPTEYLYTPEGSWARFSADHAEELAQLGKKDRRGRPAGARPAHALLRRVLIAAVLAVLLAGVVLAAGPQIRVWVRGWSGDAEGYVSMGEDTAGRPIPEALAALGITEPVYPVYLPAGHVLTEAHISEDPLLLYELYTRGDRFLSITITPVSAAALYPQRDRLPEEYRVGEIAHYLFSNSGSITAVWYTENYFVSVNGNITARAMKRIIDSVHAR